MHKSEQRTQAVKAMRPLCENHKKTLRNIPKIQEEIVFL